MKLKDLCSIKSREVCALMAGVHQVIAQDVYTDWRVIAILSVIFIDLLRWLFFVKKKRRREDDILDQL